MDIISPAIMVLVLTTSNGETIEAWGNRYNNKEMCLKIGEEEAAAIRADIIKAARELEHPLFVSVDFRCEGDKEWSE